MDRWVLPPPRCVYVYMREFVTQHLYIHTHIYMYRNKLPGGPPELLSASSHSDGPLGITSPRCVYVYMREFVTQHLYIHTHICMYHNKLPGGPPELLSASSDGPLGITPPRCVYVYMREFVTQHLYIHTHIYMYHNKLPGGPPELLSASSHSDGPLGITPPPVCVCIYA